MLRFIFTMCLLAWFTGYAFESTSQVLKVSAVGLWAIAYIYMAIELGRFVKYGEGDE